ncbi:EAL domain-containing protein [Kineosporiaceae bacterium B12]|nr:EAL domain-containing protein [Kineococcus rubinsiae]
MQRGLAVGKIVVYYESSSTWATVSSTGFEALARWQHPSRGLLHPAAFFPGGRGLRPRHRPRPRGLPASRPSAAPLTGARDLELETVVEGNTCAESTAHALRRGCRLAQGYPTPRPSRRPKCGGDGESRPAAPWRSGRPRLSLTRRL